VLRRARRGLRRPTQRAPLVRLHPSGTDVATRWREPCRETANSRRVEPPRNRVGQPSFGGAPSPDDTLRAPSQAGRRTVRGRQPWD
jgi:hypothetical protein